MSRSPLTRAVSPVAEAPDATGGTALGDNLRRIRTGMGLTLAQVAARSGLGQSSLWKVENHQMSLTYDKLAQLARGLGVNVAALFSSDMPTVAPGRRAVSRKGEGPVHQTGYGAQSYPCTDLSERRMTPIISEIVEGSLEAFGDWSRHQGEEYAYVIRGPVIFASEFYQPLQLETGDSLYYDSAMGHAFLRAGPEPAQVLSVCVDA